MDEIHFAGALLRMFRLERNWSQETLCQGICTVSYLSKIEQGKVQPNEALLRDLFAKMEIVWRGVPDQETLGFCEALYEAVFNEEEAEAVWPDEPKEISSSYLDQLVLKSYLCRDAGKVPAALRPLLDERQRCLMYLLEGKPLLALQTYPCALAAKCTGANAYASGAYASALEYLQRGYDLACQAGQANLMMYCQVYMANCHSDMQNFPDMLAHYQIAKRLARSLGKENLIQTIDYNIASTHMECGNFSVAYPYFAALKNPTAMDYHKLAICCEKMEKREEALAALDCADACATMENEREVCALVRYRLEHPAYRNDSQYGAMLMETFQRLKGISAGYARFHLPWVEEWCTTNRQYRLAYEILKDFL